MMKQAKMCLLMNKKMMRMGCLCLLITYFFLPFHFFISFSPDSHLFDFFCSLQLIHLQLEYLFILFIFISPLHFHWFTQVFHSIPFSPLRKRKREGKRQIRERERQRVKEVATNILFHQLWFVLLNLLLSFLELLYLTSTFIFTFFSTLYHLVISFPSIITRKGSNSLIHLFLTPSTFCFVTLGKREMKKYSEKMRNIFSPSLVFPHYREWERGSSQGRTRQWAETNIRVEDWWVRKRGSNQKESERERESVN